MDTQTPWLSYCQNTTRNTVTQASGATNITPFPISSQGTQAIPTSGLPVSVAAVISGSLGGALAFVVFVATIVIVYYRRRLRQLQAARDSTLEGRHLLENKPVETPAGAIAHFHRQHQSASSSGPLPSECTIH